MSDTPLIQPPLRSPFVARLMTNALLDATLQTMHNWGIEASPATLAALRSLREEIDERVKGEAASHVTALPAGGDAAASIAVELHAINERLLALHDKLHTSLAPPPIGTAST